MEEQERVQLFQFATGRFVTDYYLLKNTPASVYHLRELFFSLSQSSRVPFGGFTCLRSGSELEQKFTISKVVMTGPTLPTASTWLVP